MLGREVGGRGAGGAVYAKGLRVDGRARIVLRGCGGEVASWLERISSFRFSAGCLLLV